MLNLIDHVILEIFVGISKRKTSWKRESEEAVENGSMLKFLHYEHVNSEVEWDQAQQVFERSYTFENVVQEIQEENIITVNTEQSSETDDLIK